MDQLPRLGKRELICLLLFTCNYVVPVRRGFLFLWVLGMGFVILLWHSLSLPYNFLSFKHVCISLLPAKIKKIQSKLKALEWPQHIYNCVSMRIFPNTQGQLTPQSVVGSYKIFPFITLWKLSVTMETMFLIRSSSKHNAAFPLPQ